MTEQATPLVHPTREVAANGKTYAIKRMSALQTIQASQSLFALYQVLATAADGLTIGALVSAAPTAVVDLLAISLDEPFDVIGDMDPIEFLDVAEAWWEVNGSFFAQRLLPRVLQLLADNGALNAKSEAKPTSASRSKKPSSTSASRGRATKPKR